MEAGEEQERGWQLAPMRVLTNIQGIFCGQTGRLVTLPFLPVPKSSPQSSALNETLLVRLIIPRE